MMANDVILGSSGTTKLISDGTGTYIYNNLHVSGNINNEDLTTKLNSKATASQLSTLSSTVNNKADQTYLITNFYNKDQSDSLLQGKANSNNVYSISQIDSALAHKANATDLYNKANASEVYSKIESDSKFATQTALDLKANLADPSFTGTVSGITKAMVGSSECRQYERCFQASLNGNAIRN
jgi:hypothetical protein